MSFKSSKTKHVVLTNLLLENIKRINFGITLVVPYLLGFDYLNYPVKLLNLKHRVFCFRQREQWRKQKCCQSNIRSLNNRRTNNILWALGPKYESVIGIRSACQHAHLLTGMCCVVRATLTTPYRVKLSSKGSPTLQDFCSDRNNKTSNRTGSRERSTQVAKCTPFPIKTRIE